MSELNGKCALITGGSKGAGLSIARRLAQAGMHIALLVRQDTLAAEQACTALRTLGVEAQWWQADMTDRPAVQQVIAAALARFGSLDLLVNNAGATAAAPLLALGDHQWQQVLNTNLTGPFVVTTEAVPHMPPGSVVINLAGVSAHRSYPGAGAYGPSKAALVNLTSQMALEWAHRGIRVCGVSPGPIREREGWQQQEPELANEIQRLPLKRAVTPDEVAQAVYFLATAEAMTGQMLLLDAGGASTWYMTQ